MGLHRGVFMLLFLPWRLWASLSFQCLERDGQAAFLAGVCSSPLGRGEWPGTSPGGSVLEGPVWTRRLCRGWALQDQPAVRHHVSEEAELRPEGAGEEAGGEPA